MTAMPPDRLRRALTGRLARTAAVATAAGRRRAAARES
jgi:hypothetical protein